MTASAASQPASPTTGLLCCRRRRKPLGVVSLSLPLWSLTRRSSVRPRVDYLAATKQIVRRGLVCRTYAFPCPTADQRRRRTETALTDDFRETGEDECRGRASDQMNARAFFLRDLIAVCAHTGDSTTVGVESNRYIERLTISAVDTTPRTRRDTATLADVRTDNCRLKDLRRNRR